MSEAFFFRAVVNVIFDPLFVADSIRAVGGSQIACHSVHYAESFTEQSSEVAEEMIILLIASFIFVEAHIMTSHWFYSFGTYSLFCI